MGKRSIVLLITALHWATGFGTEGDDIAAIRALGERWLEAYTAGDKDALADCFTADAWVMPRGRPKLVHREAIVATLDGRPPGMTLEVEVQEEEIQILGDWAWTVATFTVSVDAPGDGQPPSRSAGRAMLIYKKEGDGKWRIHRDMDTPLPQETHSEPQTDASTIDSALLRTAIVVQDRERSKAFYESALGYRVSFDGDITRPAVLEQLGLPKGQRVHFVVLKGADRVGGTAVTGAMIGLLEIQNPAPAAMKRPRGADLAVGESMLAVVTSDIEHAYRRAQALGIRVLLPPTEAPDGSEAEMVLHDPDGVRVHVVQRYD